MARPAGRPRAVREASVYDLREEFLARCRAKNLSDRTMEWYEDRTLQLCDLWTARGAALASELTVEHVEDALVDLRERGLAPQTVRGFAQIAKTLCRFGHRKGLIPDEIAHDLEMPRVPQTIIETFTDDQLEALLSAPDRRRWIGIKRSPYWVAIANGDNEYLLLVADDKTRLTGFVHAQASRGTPFVRVYNELLCPIGGPLVLICVKA
jgi:integrase